MNKIAYPKVRLNGKEEQVTMTRHLAQFNITEAFLKQCLGMTEETNIVDIHSTPYYPGFFTIVIEHPNLSETPEGGPPYEMAGTEAGKFIGWTERKGEGTDALHENY